MALSCLPSALNLDALTSYTTSEVGDFSHPPSASTPSAFAYVLSPSPTLRLDSCVTLTVSAGLHAVHRRAKGRSISRKLRKRAKSKKIDDRHCQKLRPRANHEFEWHLCRRSRHPKLKKLIKQLAANSGSDRKVARTERIDRPSQYSRPVASRYAILQSLFWRLAALQRRKASARCSPQAHPPLTTSIINKLSSALETATRAHSTISGIVSLNLTRLVNLFRLFLRLLNELLQLLILAIIYFIREPALVSWRHFDRERKDWFQEYPDARHPRSTAWPWTIKPSLAVLWGVCWMFYDRVTVDSEGNMVDVAGQILLHHSAVENFFFEQASHSRVRGSQHRGAYSQQLRMPLGDTHTVGPIYNRPSGAQPPSNNLTTLDPAQSDSRREARKVGLAYTPHSSARGADDTVTHTFADLPSSATHPTYAATPSAFVANSRSVAGINNWLPEDAIAHIPRVGQHYDSTYTAEAWQIPQPLPPVPSDQAGLLHQPVPRSQTQLPPRSGRQVPPAIKITTDNLNLNVATDFHTAQDDIYPTAAPLDAVSPYHQHRPALLSPSARGLMAFGQQPQQVADVKVHHVPVSPVSPHSGGHSRGITPSAEPMSRKRSFSELSQQGQPQEQPQPVHSPHGSNASLSARSPNGLQIDDFPPQQRISRTLKRSDAPLNDQRKYFCDFAPECAGITFDRKCEWSKHMDKHDRPYRCPHPACAKLQGFTYSGGLLRHEREVHGKHGGPKAFLMCPVVECKRHTEKGFTRRENLNEHVRRVHAGKADALLNADILQGVEVDTPASRISEAAVDIDDLGSPVVISNKRKRSLVHDGDAIVPEGIEDLREQVKRLRTENEAQRAVIQRFEDEAQAQAARLVALEHTLRQYQQGHA